MLHPRRVAIRGFLVLSLSFAGGMSAQAASFSDVSEDSPFYAAVEYMKLRGILQGYPNGTFQPNKAVNRAEAAKIIVAPLATPEALASMTTSVYGDVPVGAWYLPYVEFARKNLGIIDGPPKTSTFKGTDPVLKAQFFKMFFLANGIDSNALYSEIKRPFSMDTQVVADWYYPYMRTALATSMTMISEDGRLAPDKQLTRGDIALLLHRYYMYREGRRTQALLSAAEGDIVNVLQLLEQQDIVQADYAAARALIAARGALTSKPDEPIVKGAVKTAEGFNQLVLAYTYGSAQQYQQAITFAGEAWKLAEKAKEFSPALASVATQMQAIAKGMADEARAKLGQ